MLEISRDTLHHAYLFLGEKENARRELLDTLTSLNISLTNNPDLHFFEEEVFGIAEARQLRDRAQSRSFGEIKVFVISPSRFTHEAQNALLKTLEDPISNTHFFVLMHEESVVIPTLRSRMQMVKISQKQEISSEAKNFLESSLKERLEFAKEFSDREESLAAFLDNLLLTIKDSASDPRVLEKIYKTRLFADDRSVSSRLVLEHLALVL